MQAQIAWRCFDMFSPYELSIIIHYCTRGNDWEGMDAPIFLETIISLIDKELIAVQSNMSPAYKATDKAKVYLDKLCNTPLPVKKWVFE